MSIKVRFRVIAIILGIVSGISLAQTGRAVATPTTGLPPTAYDAIACAVTPSGDPNTQCIDCCAAKNPNDVNAALTCTKLCNAILDAQNP